MVKSKCAEQALKWNKEATIVSDTEHPSYSPRNKRDVLGRYELCVIKTPDGKIKNYVRWLD